MKEVTRATASGPMEDRDDDAPGDDAPDTVPEPSETEVTMLLRRWTEGDPDALDALLPFVYDTLRRRARGLLRGERMDHTLQPTALVHEAFLRLAGQNEAVWHNEAQFFAVAGRVMRRILVDHARARAAKKRAANRTDREVDAIAAEPEKTSVLRLDDALTRLALLDPDQARVVELRYFAGLTIEETAAALGWSPATVKREWTVARAWLRRELDAEQ